MYGGVFCYGNYSTETWIITVQSIWNHKNDPIRVTLLHSKWLSRWAWVCVCVLALEGFRLFSVVRRLSALLNECLLCIWSTLARKNMWVTQTARHTSDPTRLRWLVSKHCVKKPATGWIKETLFTRQPPSLSSLGQPQRSFPANFSYIFIKFSFVDFPFSCCWSFLSRLLSHSAWRGGSCGSQRTGRSFILHHVQWVFIIRTFQDRFFSLWYG